jgi:hypothetical protein
LCRVLPFRAVTLMTKSPLPGNGARSPPMPANKEKKRKINSKEIKAPIRSLNFLITTTNVRQQQLLSYARLFCLSPNSVTNCSWAGQQVTPSLTPISQTIHTSPQSPIPNTLPTSSLTSPFQMAATNPLPKKLKTPLTHWKKKEKGTKRKLSTN